MTMSFGRTGSGMKLSKNVYTGPKLNPTYPGLHRSNSLGGYPFFPRDSVPVFPGDSVISVYNATLTEYFGAYEYVNGRFSRLNTPTGYRDSLGVHVYVRDWQGNIRAVVRRNAQGVVELEQATYYYPYGMPMAESTNPTANRYKYTGKELLTDHALNLYDYGARLLNAVEGFFISIDDMAWSTPDISPYAMCGGDPINRIDPSGNKWLNLDDVNRLKASINNTIKSLDKKIETNNKKIESLKDEAISQGKDLPTKKIEALSNKNKDLQTRVKNLNQTLSDINLLDAHPHYMFKLEKIGDGQPHHVRRNSDKTISIQTSNHALSVHEITHIRQSLAANNHLRFNNNYLGHSYYDAKSIEDAQAHIDNNEIEAYKMQYSLNPNTLPVPAYNISDISTQYLRSIPPVGDSIPYPSY